MPGTIEFDALTLKKIRTLFTLTQGETAEILGCTQSRISKQDKQTVSLNDLAVICENQHYTFLCLLVPSNSIVEIKELN